MSEKNAVHFESYQDDRGFHHYDAVYEGPLKNENVDRRYERHFWIWLIVALVVGLLPALILMWRFA